jgi:hypothetical protein
MQTQITRLPAKQANLEIGREAVYIERNLGLLGMPYGAEMIRYADITHVSVNSGFFSHHLRIETKHRTLEFVTGNKMKLRAFLKELQAHREEHLADESCANQRTPSHRESPPPALLHEAQMVWHR